MRLTMLWAVGLVTVLGGCGSLAPGGGGKPPAPENPAVCNVATCIITVTVAGQPQVGRDSMSVPSSNAGDPAEGGVIIRWHLLDPAYEFHDDSATFTSGQDQIVSKGTNPARNIFTVVDRNTRRGQLKYIVKVYPKDTTKPPISGPDPIIANDV